MNPGVPGTRLGNEDGVPVFNLGSVTRQLADAEKSPRPSEPWFSHLYDEHSKTTEDVACFLVDVRTHQ